MFVFEKLDKIKNCSMIFDMIKIYWLVNFWKVIVCLSWYKFCLRVYYLKLCFECFENYYFYLILFKSKY